MTDQLIQTCFPNEKIKFKVKCSSLKSLCVYNSLANVQYHCYPQQYFWKHFPQVDVNGWSLETLSEPMLTLWSLQSLHGVCLSLEIICLCWLPFVIKSTEKRLFIISEIYVEYYATSQLMKEDEKIQENRMSLNIWQIPSKSRHKL